MFRDKLKRAAKRVVKGVTGDEKGHTPRQWTPPESIDSSKVPKIVDGNGDMPTPNNRGVYGRPYLSALLASGVGPTVIDVRPPEEAASGTLVDAIIMPGLQATVRGDSLPGKDVSLAVLDADGGETSHKVAEWLREAGWAEARQIQGGWAEWVENAEASERPEIPGELEVGAPVELKSGERGWIQAAFERDGELLWDVLLDIGNPEGFRTGVKREELKL